MFLSNPSVGLSPCLNFSQIFVKFLFVVWEHTVIFWSFCHLLCPSNTHSLSFVFFSSRRDDWSGWRDRQSEYRVLHGRGLTANTAGARAQTHALVSIADDGRALRLSSEDSSRVWVWVHVSWHAVITKVIPTGLLGMPSLCVCVSLQDGSGGGVSGRFWSERKSGDPLCPCVSGEITWLSGTPSVRDDNEVVMMSVCLLGLFSCPSRQSTRQTHANTLVQLLWRPDVLRLFPWAVQGYYR